MGVITLIYFTFSLPKRFESHMLYKIPWAKNRKKNWLESPILISSLHF